MNNILTVEYDLSDAVKEGKIRDKLIEMGWTPPPDEPKIYYVNVYPDDTYGPLYTSKYNANAMRCEGAKLKKFIEVLEHPLNKGEK